MIDAFTSLIVFYPFPKQALICFYVPAEQEFWKHL